MGMSDDNNGRADMRLAPRRSPPAADAGMSVACDRCHVALAQVEVLTARGSVFLCRHHYAEHGVSIAAAGHRIRDRFGLRVRQCT